MSLLMAVAVSLVDLCASDGSDRRMSSAGCDRRRTEFELRGRWGKSTEAVLDRIYSFFLLF